MLDGRSKDVGDDEQKIGDLVNVGDLGVVYGSKRRGISRIRRDSMTFE